MAYSIRLPDGTLVENIPDDVDPSEAKKRISSAYPDIGKPPADTRKAEDVGAFERIGTSFKRGFEGLGDVASGLGLAGTAMFGSKEDAAKKMADIKAEQEAQRRGTPTLTAADIQRIAEERGLVSAGAQVPSYIAEQILQSAPQMAIPLAVGAGAAAVSGPFAPIVGPVAGITAYGIQQFGNFLVRQAEAKKDPEELEIAKAAITAGGTAPIGYFADKFTAGLGNIGSKKAMSEIYAELGRRGVIKEVGGRAAKGAGVGIIAEAPTEVLEQAAERWQAGLSLNDEDAMREYKEAFFGAAAAGAGIGAGAKAVGGYGEYRAARQADKALDSFGSQKNAFEESEEVGAGDDTGVAEPSVSGVEEQVGGTEGAGALDTGELGGGELPSGPARDREAAVDNQLNTLRQQQAEIAAFDPNDPRIGEIEETIKELRTFTAPGIQQGFDLQPADETTQRAIETPAAPEFALEAETGALPTGEVAPIEEVKAEPKAKMMLIGEGANPTAPAESFLNSIKPATGNPAQAVQFKNEVRNLIEDMLEFIGQTRKQVARYREEGAEAPTPAEGPDVSVPLTGPQRDMRLNVLDKFFDSLSAAPAGQENQTATLAQRLQGMSAEAQTQAFQNLLNIPNINTVRGIKDVRNKLQEAIAKFEGEQIGAPVEEAATVYKNDDTQSTFVRRAIMILKNIPENMRTPEEKAAVAYFGRFNFGLAMRSAAFDLGSKPNEYFTGPVFKGQNKDQAELFQDWVKENLPAEEYKKFQATVADFKKQTEKAEAFQKKSEEISKMGAAAAQVARVEGRAPTGKMYGRARPDVGLDMKPSEVKKLDTARFYPMHPAMQLAIEEGNVDSALRILEKSGNKFQAGLAKRLRSLGLRTSVVFDQQQQIAETTFKAKFGEQYAELVAFLESTNNPNAQYFTNPSDFKAMREGLNKITDPALLGQVTDLKAGVDAALGILESSGTYVYGMDVVNLNRAMGGASNYSFIHELVHAATVYSLDPTNFDSLDKKQQAAVRQLQALYETSKKTQLAEYGFTNLEEFVAEAFSNEKFQDLLKSIPYRAGEEHFDTAQVLKKAGKGQADLEFEAPKGQERGSLWDMFTKLVARLFGMDNVLGYTLANGNVIMQAPPALTTTVSAFNAPRNKKSILAGVKAVGPAPMNFIEKMFAGKPSWEMVKTGMPGFLQDMNDSVRKYYLGAFTLRQLNDMIGHRIPQFKEFLAATENMLDERNKILEETKKIVDKWMRFQSKEPQKAEKMNLLMLDATLQGKDPAKGTTGIKLLDEAWNEIGPDGQKIYVEVRDFYRRRLDGYIQTNIDNKVEALMGRGYSEADAKNHPDIAKIKAFFNKHNIEPYFPIRRFGRFSLQIGTGNDKEFYMFESARERRAFKAKRMKELKDAGVFPLPEATERNSIGKLSEQVSNMKEFAFFKELRDLIQAGEGDTPAKLKANLDESLEQLYFLTLPDQSVRKMFMNRKGTAGMNTDMLRAFTSSAFHMAYQHSRYKYSRELYGAISGAKASLAGRTDRESTIDDEYLGELEERLSYIMNPTDTGTIPSVLSNVSFIWYMTAPASALVNMMGVPAIGLPVVSARFGWANTSAKMSEFAKKFAGSGFKNQEGEWDFPTLDRTNLTDVQRRAYEQLVADGVIDITLSHDLVGMTEAPTNLYTGRTNKVMKVLSGAFHGAEKFNREVVSMATFDLSYEKAKKAGYTDEAAYKKAINDAKELTYKSMFDYSTLNKPRYFQNSYAKVILQFKQFSQQMTYLLARSVYEATYKKFSDAELQDIRLEIKGDRRVNMPNAPELTDKELDAAVQDYIKNMRKEARDRLAGTLGMTAMFAGVTGLPLWSVVAGTMNALQAVFGEDEEEYDFNNWFKNWTNNTFGGFVGDSISRGVASQIFGGDLASRMGLNDLWFRDTRQSNDEVTALQNMMINLLGPTAGLMVSAAETAKQYNDGHIQRAMETASPAFLKNFMKGARYAGEGRATTLKGDELVGDVSGYESLLQGLGFNPERVAQRQKSNIEMKGMEQKILNRRQDLLNAFFMGVDNDDDDMIDRVLDKVEKFNAANPEVAITGDNLTRSVQTRYKNRALAELTGGISINKKLIGKLEDMGGYGNPD